MSGSDWLFRAYAMSCMMDADSVREYDAARFRSNPDEGFQIWRRTRLDEYRSANPGAFDDGRLTDEDGFIRHCTGYGLMVSATWGHA